MSRLVTNRDLWPERLARVFVCTWRGHDHQLRFAGDTICRRCRRGLGRWR